jgi:hypothetical protein
MGKPWENGKTMEIIKKHRENVGKPWENRIFSSHMIHYGPIWLPG